MNKGVIVGIFLLTLVLGVGSPIHGETEGTTDNKGVYTLGEVVVTGKGTGVESIGTVREIGSGDIEKKGARTLNEALELLPGLDVRIGAQGIPRINLRGLRSRHVILVLNGIPFNSTFDGQFDPTIIPVESIAKIKVSYGNHSVLYGQGGLGGVINIITKKGETGHKVTALAELGERGDILSQLTFSGGGDNMDFFLSGSHSDSDGFRLSSDFTSTSEEDGGIRENSDQKRSNFFANAGFSPSKNLDMGIIINYLQGEFGKPPGTINDGSDPFAARPKHERVKDYDGISGQISAGYDTSGPFSIRSWLFANQLDQEENRYDNDSYNSIARKGSYLKDNETQIFGGTIQSGYDLETAGRFTLALSAQKQEFETSGVIRDVRLGGGNWDLRNFDEDQNLNTYSSALEYEVSPLNDFGLVLGYGHYWLDKNAGENDDHGSFLAGAHYDVCQSTRIKASVAGKIRFPSIRQLFDQTSGNTDLTTEKSYNFELGLEQTFAEHILVMLTGFLIDVEDYIEKYETTEIYENNEKYRFQGFELSAETQSIENIMLRAGYSFMDSEDRSRASAIDELEYRPEHKITFEGEYGFDCGVSAYVNVMRVKNQHYYSRNTPIIKSKLNDYTLVNVKIESSLLNDTMSIYVGVDNLFDEDYEESYAFPRAGRNAYAGVKIRF